MRVGDHFNRGIIEEAIAFDLEECDRLFVVRSAIAFCLIYVQESDRFFYGNAIGLGMWESDRFDLPNFIKERSPIR